MNGSSGYVHLVLKIIENVLSTGNIDSCMIANQNIPYEDCQAQ